jgi:hypothetical protein
MARGTQSGSFATARAGAARTYRGSRKRAQRITLRGNWSTEFVVAAFTIVVSLLILIPLLL